MSSTFFTEPPHWRWLIILYFFIGGLAGGCYFLASMIDLVGRPTDRPLARLGYLIAVPAVVVCGILLIADLGRPERFWHMLLQSAPWPPVVIGPIVSALVGLAGFFLVSCTGVLLAVTNRPIWSDTTLLGAVFLVSSASTSIALLMLLGSRRVFLVGGLRALARFDTFVLVLELITLVALVVSLGSLARVWLSAWGGL